MDFGKSLIPMNHVLVVDDEPVLRDLMRAALDYPDLEMDEAESAGEAIKRLAEKEFNLVVTDKNMPEMDGLELMRLAKERWPYLEVIMVTGFASLETALTAIDLGAYDYLLKP